MRGSQAVAVCVPPSHPHFAIYANPRLIFPPKLQTAVSRERQRNSSEFSAHGKAVPLESSSDIDSDLRERLLR